MDAEIAATRERIARARTHSNNGGPRLFEAVGLDALGLARQLRSQGWPWGRICKALGVSETTVHRWRKDSGELGAPGEGEASWVPVEVTTGALPPLAHPRTSSLSLVTPGGLRLEGLDEAAAVRLLRLLG